MQTNPLLEVRKAYRLLYDYQARILDLMTFIGQSYNIPFQKGYPKFSTRGQNRLDNWAWDWLYMYYYSFHFSNNTGIEMSVFLLNDSGFYEAYFKDSTISALDVDKFKAVENSKSKLIFVAAFEKWDWFDKVHFESEKFITENKGVLPESNMVWKSYDIEDFFTEESSLTQLKDFEKHCEANNIPLKLKEAVFS
jgi:hypothetical protein